ncbi:hypothetical protein V8E54_006574 [Elaphomyces granulatus]
MPTDLQYFIGYEVDDYQRRLVAASSGCEIQRKVPTSQDYIGAGGRYKVIRNKYTATEEKEWSGAPGAILMKASLSLLQPFVSEDN